MPEADLALKNGKIVTVDKDFSTRETVKESMLMVRYGVRFVAASNDMAQALRALQCGYGFAANNK